MYGGEGDPYDRQLSSLCIAGHCKQYHSQYTLHCASVEGCEDGWWQAGSLQAPQELEVLLCILGYRSERDQAL